MSLGWPGNASGSPHPGEDPGPVGETTSLGWPGNASGPPRKNWSKWPGTGTFGFLCSSCCTPGSIPGEAVGISLEEFSNAIKSLQSGRSPGPDGYIAKFYKKKLFPKIGHTLLDMYNESFANGILPATLSQTIISLILKKTKGPFDCASYCPISLLNVDYKILAKLLAKRLESVLPSVVSSDLTGFIKNRYSSDAYLT